MGHPKFQIAKLKDQDTTYIIDVHKLFKASSYYNRASFNMEFDLIK